MLFRILLIGLLLYWILRVFGLLGSKKKSRIKRGRTRQKVNPFEGADIEDVSYTELPPDETVNNENEKKRQSGNKE
ncbi:hypothetical protein CEE37_05550 [candidate division LCP-89 bacterium B3_LCP]|uniref:Uncharacterized protein n=1 Tax=candidate division LCP-89 bacterium B3_LCP TaxID=2012998 RepID=A0A532V1P4_UNCL8|nr:MAG: hypothetical protein CEE37_05550 [candidate division LCP-89 bacterium B3_LCP]